MEGPLIGYAAIRRLWTHRKAKTLEELRDEVDLTQQKLAEAHKMASLGRLSAGIVHEINTPIGSILSNNETIRRSLETLKKLVATSQAEGQPLPPRATVILDTLANLTDIDKLACERIYAVIRSLKTFARVNESDLRKVDLHETILNTLKLSGCVFRRRVTVVTNFADLPEIECYPGLMNQAFLNLIVNAGTGDPRRRHHHCEHAAGRRLRRDFDCRHRFGYSARKYGNGSSPPASPPSRWAKAPAWPVPHTGNHRGYPRRQDLVRNGIGKGTTFFIRIPIQQPRKQEQA